MEKSQKIQWFSIFTCFILLGLCWYWWRKKGSQSTNKSLALPISLASQALNTSLMTKEQLNIESFLSLKNTMSSQIHQLSTQIDQINTSILKQQQVQTFAIHYQRFDLAKYQTEIDLSELLAIGKILNIERNGLSMDEQVEYHIDQQLLSLNIPADAGEFISIEYQAHTI